jgi:conjugal transfer pilus assembly protein TraE
MKFQLQTKRLGQAQFQRNFLSGLSCILLGTCFVLSVALFFKKERIIICPPELKNSYWVEGNQFSPSYIEEMSLFFAHLLLDVTESSIGWQGSVILRYVIPESYGALKAKILDDEKRLKKEQLSLHFKATTFKLDASQLLAEITGDLISYVGSKKISQVRETYQLKLQNRSGRLLIESFSLLKTETPHEAA